MTHAEQEALSRRYSNDVIILLPLHSGAIAIFNNARELCGYANIEGDKAWDIVLSQWHPPAAREARPQPTLEDLGL